MAIIPNDVGVFVSNVINSKYDIASPTLENFPTHYDQNGHGGFMAIDSSISEVSGVESLTGKYELIIPSPRRKVGMVIYDTNPEVSTFYQCTDATACSWEEVDFRFRYFYGPTAPTASDIQVGEKWFDTVVGSEYTYLPVADGSTYKAWVDIDHIGEGETFSGYITVDLANTYYVNVGGDEMTGSLTAEKMFRNSSDTSFEDNELVTKSYVSTNFAQSSGGIFTQQITGTDAKFSGSVTAARFYGTQSISDDSQLATKKYVDDNTIGGVSFYIDGQGTPFATSVDGISLSGGSNINIEFDQDTTPNRYVISASLSTTDEYVNIDGDVMTGTLTGPFAEFTQGITTSNGFIGTLTGTNASFTGLTASNGFIGTLTGTEASFSSITASNGFIGTLTGTEASFSSITASDGFIGTLTGNYVRIGSDPSYILNFGLTADQSVYSGENPNVPVIKSPGGVLIGGNYYDKQNWLGNNVYLAPEGNVFVGIPSNIPTDWFSADGGTYPFNLYSLNVTGGIHTDRAYRWGHKKGENTFLDDEFVTRRSVMMRRAVQSGSNPIQFSQTWSQSPGSNNFLFTSLTTKKMGFDFPVDLTFRVAGSVGGDGLYSTRWFVKNIANVKPTAGNTISIYVDRDKQITLSNGNIDCASVSGGDSNTYNIGGYIENGNGEAWCFLEIAPSPTGWGGPPISYGEE